MKKHRALHQPNKDSKPILFSIWKALLPVVYVVLGVFMGPLLQQIAPPFFEPKNFPYIAYGVIVFLFLLGSTLKLSLSAKTYKRIDELEHECALFTKTLGPCIRIIPYDIASGELNQRTLGAKFEILILSNYKRYDWIRKKPISYEEPFAMQSSRRKKRYESTREKLRQEKDKILQDKNYEFRFVKILQIPDGNRLEDVFLHDPIYQEDCKFIVDMSNEDPGFANLKVADEIYFQNTFCVIDKSFLYLEFSLRDFMKKDVKPFVMLVDDSDSKIIQDFLAIFKRINNVSTRIDSI